LSKKVHPSCGGQVNLEWYIEGRGGEDM
jgi:hypothetical protein